MAVDEGGLLIGFLFGLIAGIFIGIAVGGRINYIGEPTSVSMGDIKNLEKKLQ